MGNKISTYTAITTLANGDLLDISKDMGASTYATRKITYANLLTELNTDLTLPASNNLGNANLTADNAARTYTLAGTSTESLAFLNGSAAEILKLKGDRTILIGGYTTNGFVKTSAGTGLITVSTQVAATEGGTGISSYTTGDILYSSASNTLAKLAAGTNGHVLTLAAGVPSWAAAPNLGSADLTSTSNARQFILNGTASTNYLEITNGTDELIRFRGDKQIVIGDSGGQPGIKFDTYGVTAWAMLQYLAAGSSYAWNVYNSSGQELFRFDSAGLIYASRPAGIASHMNYNSFINFHAAGTTSSLGFVQTNGSADTIYIGHSGGHGYVDIKNSTAVTKTSLAGSGDSYFINSLAVGASAANASAIFDITSTTKGLGLPSMTTTQKNAVSSPRAGLMVYDSTLNQASYYNGSTWVNI